MVVVARRSLAITLYYWKKCDLEWFQIKSQNFISNPNQITRFPNQIIILQVKSLCVMQSWFKSNHDLDLPITELSRVHCDALVTMKHMSFQFLCTGFFTFSHIVQLLTTFHCLFILLLLYIYISFTTIVAGNCAHVCVCAIVTYCCRALNTRRHRDWH